MISNGCLAIVYFVEIIWCVKMTCAANPPEIVRKSAEACADLIFFRFGLNGYIILFVN
jgi:hypothetical protein